MTKSESNRVVRISVSPRLGKVLGSYALIAMHSWFLAKLRLPSETGGAELAVGLAALTGMLASILFFVSTYGVMANAPDAMLDERELSQRNRAYFTAFKYLVLMTVLGGMVTRELQANLDRFRDLVQSGYAPGT